MRRRLCVDQSHGFAIRCQFFIGLQIYLLISRELKKTCGVAPTIWAVPEMRVSKSEDKTESRKLKMLGKS